MCTTSGKYIFRCGCKEKTHRAEQSREDDAYKKKGSRDTQELDETSLRIAGNHYSKERRGEEEKKKMHDCLLPFVCNMCVYTQYVQETETVGDVFSLSARLEFSWMTFRLIGNSLSLCMLLPFSASIFFPSSFCCCSFVRSFPGQRERKWGSVTQTQMQNKQ